MGFYEESVLYRSLGPCDSELHRSLTASGVSTVFPGPGSKCTKPGTLGQETLWDWTDPLTAMDALSVTVPKKVTGTIEESV